MTLFVPKKPESHRQKRVCSLLQTCLSSLISKGDLASKVKGKFVTLPCPITVTQVDISPDFSHASVYVMPLGGEKKKETLFYLESISSHLRHCLSKEIQLRTTPQLHFYIDKSFENQERINELLDGLSKDNESEKDEEQ